jgi:hypothetical protein
MKVARTGISGLLGAFGFMVLLWASWFLVVAASRGDEDYTAADWTAMGVLVLALGGGVIWSALTLRRRRH